MSARKPVSTALPVLKEYRYMGGKEGGPTAGMRGSQQRSVASQPAVAEHVALRGSIAGSDSHVLGGEGRRPRRGCGGSSSAARLPRRRSPGPTTLRILVTAQMQG